MAVETKAVMLDAALEYAAKGWRIFPVHTPTETGCSCREECGSPGKHPRTRNGLNEATSDTQQVLAWWTKWPDANIGLATGKGIQVLDVDGQEGADSLACLETEHGLLPPTLEALTGRGRHLYFQHEGELGNSAGKLGSKLDTRGDGGYVVLPPSLHVSGRRYEWANDEPLLRVPRWLIDKVDTPAAETLVEFVLRDHTKKHEYNYGIHPFYRGWFERALNKMHQCPEGGYGDGKGGRNQRFFNLAIWCARCVQAGMADATHVENEAKAAGRGAGLTEREMAASWESGWKDGWLKAPLPDPPNDFEERRSEPERSHKKSSLVITPLSKVRQEHVDFLWGHRLVQDGVNLLIGDGGLGKSAVALHIAKAITNGSELPDDQGQMVEGSVMLVTYEDPPALVKSRAKVLGIDFEKFFVIEGQKDEDNRVMPFNKESVKALSDALIDYPEVKLLILDPWGRYLDDDDHKEKLIRRAIAPLEQIAREHHITILIVGHTNKSTDYSSAEHRIAGHSSFKNVARSVLMIGKLTESKLAIVHVKHNWSSPALAVTYAWDENKSWKRNENPLSWGEVTRLDADDLFAARKTTKQEQAISWLRRQLIEGPVTMEELRENADEESIKWSTVEKASVALKVVKDRIGNQFSGIQSAWRLPTNDGQDYSVPGEDYDDFDPESEVF